MSNTPIELEWAWTQIEAMADGALEGADLERMQRALASDADLRRALADAEAVIGRLRGTRPPAPRAGLVLSLLSRGRGTRPAARTVTGGFGAPLVGVLSTAAIAAAFTVIVSRTPDPEREAALRDFAIAMDYLRQSAALARDQVGQQVGLGLAAAVEVSSQTLAGDDDAAGGNGG